MAVYILYKTLQNITRRPRSTSPIKLYRYLFNAQESKDIDHTKSAHKKTPPTMFISPNPKEKELRSPTPDNPPPLYTVEAYPNASDIAGLATLDLSTKKTRPISDLSAHLKLLESFHQLREDIALHDGIFGIWDSFVPSTRSEREQAEILLKIREKRWAIYVAKAASRFQTWWQASVEPGTGMLSTANLLID